MSGLQLNSTGAYLPSMRSAMYAVPALERSVMVEALVLRVLAYLLEAEFARSGEPPAARVLLHQLYDAIERR